MSGPYIPKSNERARKKAETKLQFAISSKNTLLITKYSKILQGLNEQVKNREDAYYNRKEVKC